jgi:hypothetical protein
MVYHKFCSCGRILTIGQMESNICDYCKEEQIRDLPNKEDKDGVDTSKLD